MKKYIKIAICIIILLIFLCIIYFVHKNFSNKDIILPLINGDTVTLVYNDTFEGIKVNVPQGYKMSEEENIISFSNEDEQVFIYITKGSSGYSESEIANVIGSLSYYYEEIGLSSESAYFTNENHLFGGIILPKDENENYHHIVYFVYNNTLYNVDFSCLNNDEVGMKSVGKYILETISLAS